MLRFRSARLLGAACTFALLSAHIPARAQAVGQKASLAETLFQDGKVLLDQGKIHDACLKFADSQREDPGLGTLLHLADCHEKEGKTASAWAEFTLAIEQAKARGEHDREKFAKDHATALQKQLRKLEIDAVERPTGFAITLDGESFGLGGLGTGIPLDPGDHVVEATATGKTKWTRKVTLAPAAGLDRIDIPTLEDAPVAVVAVTPAKGTEPGTVADTQKDTPPNGTKRIAGIAVGGVGVVLLGLATYYFVTASSRDSDSNQPDQIKAGNSGTLHDQAKSAQLYGFVTGGTGIAALGVGIFLIATSGGSSGSTGSKAASAASGVQVVPMLTANMGGLKLAGTF